MWSSARGARRTEDGACPGYDRDSATASSSVVPLPLLCGRRFLPQQGEAGVRDGRIRHRARRSSKRGLLATRGGRGTAPHTSALLTWGGLRRATSLRSLLFGFVAGLVPAASMPMRWRSGGIRCHILLPTGGLLREEVSEVRSRRHS